MAKQKEVISLLKERASVLKYRINYASPEQNITKTVEQYQQTIATIKELENGTAN